MKVGVIQPNYLPWRGYFDIIDDCDLFIFHDDIQYTKGDWRNRNRIKTPQGLRWLTVPVHYKNTSQLIRDTSIDNSKKWISHHINLINQYYKKSPCYDIYASELFDLLNSNYKTIAEIDIALIRWIMRHLNIETEINTSSEYNLSGKKTDRLIDLLTKSGATSYLSGPAAKSYLDESMFSDNNISLEFKTYDYQSYPQLWGEFCNNVSIIDLLFNIGIESRQYLKSLSPNTVVIK